MVSKLYGVNVTIIIVVFILYCVVLYCIVLYCIVLYCIVLYCIVYKNNDDDDVLLMKGSSEGIVFAVEMPNVTKIIERAVRNDSMLPLADSSCQSTKESMRMTGGKCLEELLRGMALKIDVERVCLHISLISKLPYQ